MSIRIAHASTTVVEVPGLLSTLQVVTRNCTALRTTFGRSNTSPSDLSEVFDGFGNLDLVSQAILLLTFDHHKEASCLSFSTTYTLYKQQQWQKVTDSASMEAGLLQQLPVNPADPPWPLDSRS